MRKCEQFERQFRAALASGLFFFDVIGHGEVPAADVHRTVRTDAPWGGHSQILPAMTFQAHAIKRMRGVVFQDNQRLTVATAAPAEPAYGVDRLSARAVAEDFGPRAK